MLGGEIMDAAAARSAVIGPSSISGRRRRRKRERENNGFLLDCQAREKKKNTSGEGKSEGRKPVALSLWFGVYSENGLKREFILADKYKGRNKIKMSPFLIRYILPFLCT